MVRYIEGRYLSQRTFPLGEILAVVAWCHA